MGLRAMVNSVTIVRIIRAIRVIGHIIANRAILGFTAINKRSVRLG